MRTIRSEDTTAKQRSKGGQSVPKAKVLEIGRQDRFHILWVTCCNEVQSARRQLESLSILIESLLARTEQHFVLLFPELLLNHLISENTFGLRDSDHGFATVGLGEAHGFHITDQLRDEEV